MAEPTKARAARRSRGAGSALPVTVVSIDDLKPHPRNYQKHPDEQLDHIIASIEEHGFYRNVVVAKDLTILAGHGVVLACQKAKLKSIPVVRLSISSKSKQAMKVLASDNEISKMSERDDRGLSELLKDIMGADPKTLLGTGYDQQSLANLVFVTRPASEIADFDASKEWVGMPEFESGGKPIQLVISFRNPADRNAFATKIGVRLTEKAKGIWWPPEDRVDASSVKFTSAKRPKKAKRPKIPKAVAAAAPA